MTLQKYEKYLNNPNNFVLQALQRQKVLLVSKRLYIFALEAIEVSDGEPSSRMSDAAFITLKD